MFYLVAPQGGRVETEMLVPAQGLEGRVSLLHWTRDDVNIGAVREDGLSLNLKLCSSPLHHLLSPGL